MFKLLKIMSNYYLALLDHDVYRLLYKLNLTELQNMKSFMISADT